MADPSLIDAVRQGLPAPVPARSAPRVRPLVLPKLGARRGLAYIPPEQRAATQQRAAVDKVLGKGGGGLGSIPGQFGDLIAGVIPGGLHLAKTAGTSAVAPFRAAVDLARGDLSPAEALQAANPTSPVGWSIRNRYDPLSRDVGESMARTAGDIRHPSRFKDAYDEGTIVSKVLEDVGNLSLVGGIAARGLTNTARTAAEAGNISRAAALDRAATVTERAAKLGGATSDLPVSVPRRALGAVGRRARGALERSEGLRLRYPDLLTEEGRLLKRETKTLTREANRAQTAVSRRLFRAATEAELDLVDQGAVTAARTGIADQYRQLVDQGVDPETARRTITSRDIPEQTFTADVAERAYDYVTGRLDPDHTARLDRYATAVDETIGQNTDRALAGVGRSKAMDARQLGDDAIPEYVEAQVRDAGFSMDTVPDDVLQSVLDNPLVYPAAWRPSMRAAGLARTQGFDVPLRPADQLAAGLPAPGYLPGGRSDLVAPNGVRMRREPLREGISGIKGVRSERMRVASEIQPFSARTIGERAGQEAAQTTMNAGLQRIMSNPRLRNIADVVGPDRLDEIRTEARQAAEAQRGSGRQIGQAEAEIYGQMLTDELAANGFEPYVGNRVDPQVGDFRPDAKVAYDQVGPDTVALPIGMKQRLAPVLAPKDLNIFLRGLETMNRKFKGLVLPFSVRWQLGDLIGGAYMAAIGGGMAPWELVDGMVKLRELDDVAQRQLFDRPDFQDAGLNFEEAQWMHGAAAQVAPVSGAGRAWRRAGDIRRGSYKLNAAINRVNRQGYVLARVQNLLDDRGLNLDQVKASKGWDDPAVQQAVQEAVDDANRVLGTFDDMTPFERRVLRNLFPFYPWTRHITKLAYRTAIDHPARMMWTMNLGTYGDTESFEGAPWLGGSIKVGDKLLPTSYVNPFNDVFQGGPTSFTGVSRALSPVVKVGAAAAGFDANQGFAPLSRPYDDNVTPLEHLRDAGYTALKSIPQTRVAMNLAPTTEIAGIGLGPHQARYDSGALMVTRRGRDRGQPISTQSRLQAVAPLFGLPWVTSIEDAQAIEESQRAQAESNRRRARNQVRYGDG